MFFAFRMPANWQSVAERINELEKQQKQQQTIHDHNNKQQQQQHYTYLDPSKTHRVPNPTLKAFQKNAIQSYFERQQQQQQSIRRSNGSKSDDLSKLKAIGGGGKALESSQMMMAVNSSSQLHQHQQQRPQSLNLGIATSAAAAATVSLPTTPSSSASSSTSQRSSISGWPNSSPSTNSPIMIGGNGKAATAAAEVKMMKNTNDIAKMNMKNSAISLGEKQFTASNNNNINKNQSISKNIFTSFCEIKTENYSSAVVDGLNGSPPPPLPRKSSILRR